jgi:hypothetical protein
MVFSERTFSWLVNCKSLKCKKDNLLGAKGTSKMSSFKDTIEKIKNLETEKKSLLVEIEELKKMADAKAIALESEVGALRDEVKSIKILINNPESSGEQGQKNKIQI